MHPLEPGTLAGGYTRAMGGQRAIVRFMKVGLPVLAGLLVGFGLGRRAGAFLVVDQPRVSDALVVPGGDLNDARYWKGLHLLQVGDARTMIYDVPNRTVTYGMTQVRLAEAFVARSAGAMQSRIQICPLWADSTVDEAANVAPCLARVPGPVRRVLLVTSDYHSRRAFAIFRARLPQYQWSVAAAHDPYSFGVNWWQRRAWAKTCAGEWQRLLWWELVDRWRDGPVHAADAAAAQATGAGSTSKR